MSDKIASTAPATVNADHRPSTGTKPASFTADTTYNNQRV